MKTGRKSGGGRRPRHNKVRNVGSQELTKDTLISIIKTLDHSESSFDVMMQALEEWAEGGNQIPAEVASEIASLLSHPEFYTGKRARDFLFDIAYFLGEYLDSDCRAILVRAVINSYPKYADGVSCLTALDLIIEFSTGNDVVDVLRPLSSVCSGTGLELFVDTVYDMWRFRLSDEGARDKCIALMKDIHRSQSDPRILSATTHYLQEMRVLPGPITNHAGDGR